MLFTVLITIIVAAVLVIVIMSIRSIISKKNDVKNVSQKIQKKGKSAILKDAEKKLSKDPHNIPALEMIGDLYYQEKNWEKIWAVYKTLYDLSSAHVEVDVNKCTLRMGIAAFNLNKLEDAEKILLSTLKKNPENFDCNYYLGKTFYQVGIFDKAVYCLKKAKAIQPENLDVTELLGLTFFKSQKYRESLPFLKRILDEKPDNKELLYDMAIAMSECGMGDKALKIFVHLRPDPQYGPQSCLEAGKMHEKIKEYDKAVKDYEIALKLSNVPEQLLLQIKYRLANTCIAMNDMSKGLEVLKQIQMQRTGYKDVDSLVARYSELNQNKNLQTYLMSGTSDFIALCRKFISIFYKGAFVKVEDVQVASESVEVICAIESPAWDAKQIFRFYRTQNVIGDIYIREFHGKIRDTKCDKGICVTMGSFSESAHKFIDGRPIDLIEKEELVKILKKVNVFN